MPEQNSTNEQPELIRGVGTLGATALNMIDMIGVGPFITMPLIIAAMGGPQAMLGWILGALLVMCDGLVWAELGASMPKSGGPYNYLKEIYGANKLGRLMSFLFIWQLTFSAPLSIASGSIGFAGYATYAFPVLDKTYFAQELKFPIPLLGDFTLNIAATLGTFVAIGMVVLCVFLLYRKITIIEKFSKVLWVVVMLTIAWVIFAGLTNFNPQIAFDFPPDAFQLNQNFFLGLGAALLISVYDYWGYYNVNFFAGEVKNPEKTIPRAIMFSILAVAAIYIVMNISVLGVIPWREFSETASSDARKYVISVFMERLYGGTAGIIATILIMLTAFASVFSLLLGYSRVPFAAASDGNYFKIFSKVHPEHRFPYVSLLIMGAIDRTEWQFGQQWVNILMLSVAYRQVSIPLLWIILDEKGCSDDEEREAILKQFIDEFGVESIRFVTADREFCSKRWLTYLIENKISFRLRIKASYQITNARGRTLKAGQLCQTLKSNQRVELHGSRRLWTQAVYVAMWRKPDGNNVLVISNEQSGQILKEYGERWKIETLFGILKTRGFCLEETHLTKVERVGKLLSILTIAVSWALLSGGFESQVKPLKTKNHGRFEKSLFRLGFDALRNCFCQLTTNFKQKQRFQQLTLLLSCT